MDRIVNLAEVVAEVVASYERPSPMATMYYVHDEAKHVDLVLVIPHDRQIEPHIVVMTRLVGARVIVEIDTTDHPLEEALLASGITRTQVILAYAGESISGG